MHGGVAKDQLKEENLEAVKAGIVNLERHVNNVKKYGLEPVIALNAFIHDTEAETEFVKQWAQEQGVRIAITEVWEKGGKGGVDLAHHVLEVIDQPQTFKHLYELEQPLESKIETIVKEIYGGSKVTFSSKAQKQLKQFKRKWMGQLSSVHG